jgi:glutaminyl-tRNA synthetase
MTVQCATHNAKANGAFAWVGVADGLSAEVHLHNRQLTDPQPDAGVKNFIEALNPNSLKVVQAKIEPSLTRACADQKFQFERHGHFVADSVDHTTKTPVFNFSAGLKDS